MATGIERPLWGPLYKINGYRDEEDMDVDRYDELKNVPPPLGINLHRIEKRYFPYEEDKI